MLFKKKSIYSHKILDKVNININDLSMLDEDKFMLKCESADYRFCEYKTSKYSHGYILAFNKHKNCKPTYFGEAYDYCVVFKDFLFMYNSIGEVGFPDSRVKSINIYTGKVHEYDIRREYSNMVFVNGYGRCKTADKFEKCEIIDNSLYIFGHRSVDNDKSKNIVGNNKDFIYKFIYTNNKFDVEFVIDENTFVVDNLQKEFANGLIKIFKDSKIDYYDVGIIFMSCRVYLTISLIFGKMELDEFDSYLNKFVVSLYKNGVIDDVDEIFNTERVSILSYVKSVGNEFTEEFLDMLICEIINNTTDEKIEKYSTNYLIVADLIAEIINLISKN